MSRVEIISASAGTGKTTRLARLIHEAVAAGTARPEAVVATTFTKRAAAELAERAGQTLLEAGEAKLLGGEPLHRIEALAGSGGLREFRWILAAPEGMPSVRVTAEAPKAGRASREIELPRDEEPRS